MLKSIYSNNIKSKTIQHSERIEYIDIFRAVGIVLMIMGHIGFGDKFDFFIHAFHMPMFFVISGYFFSSNKNIKNFLQKKAKTLLVPYIFFGILHFAFICFLNHNISIEPLKHLLFVNTDGLPIAGALWFLTALFLSQVMFYFIDKVKNPYKFILVILISFIGNIATKILPFRLPFALDAAFTGVGLMYVGNLVKKYKQNKYVNKIINMNALYLLFLIPISFVLISINTYINMRIGEYGILPLFWINAALSCLIILILSKQLDKFLNNSLKKYIISIGKDSITYLCLNQVTILIIGKMLTILGYISNVTILVKLLELIMVLIALWIFNLVIKNSKLKILIGK